MQGIRHVKEQPFNLFADVGEKNLIFGTESADLDALFFVFSFQEFALCYFDFLKVLTYLLDCLIKLLAEVRVSALEATDLGRKFFQGLHPLPAFSDAIAS